MDKLRLKIFIKPGFTDITKDENILENEKEKFTAPKIGLYNPPEFYAGIDDFYKELLEKNDKTELDKLNLFLLQLGSKDKIGYRKKLVIIRKYLKSIGCDFAK